MTRSGDGDRKALVVGPGEGREYDMGRMRAVFFADGEQTANRYSISEWRLEPRTEGPGAHSHPDDHIFHVLEGTLSLIVDGKHTDAPRGSYALVPGGLSHDFHNAGAEACRFISINVPAGFEKMMPQLVEWFADNPLGDVGA
ncbi:MAG: cupin domain-containing protein [Myxococcota bacterium]